jgi:hypothetical protein
MRNGTVAVGRTIPRRSDGVWLLFAVSACASSAPVVTHKQNRACTMDGAVGGAPFRVSQAQTTLTNATRAALSCSEVTRTETVARKAKVTFSLAGCVLDVNLELLGDELTATEADCVANAFLEARVDAYSGHPVTVSKAFTLAPAQQPESIWRPEP